jgi:DNA invertase Pin-like site-specific DNA recombinase
MPATSGDSAAEPRSAEPETLAFDIDPSRDRPLFEALVNAMDAFERERRQERRQAVLLWRAVWRDDEADADVEQQAEACRAFARRHGWRIIEPGQHGDAQ